MKIRIASSIAIAAALALSATGCSLMAPIGTNEPYSPSDGIDVSVDGLDVRNLMLIADESGENFNVVFSSVNLSDEPTDLTITFVGEGSQNASADFTVPAGNTRFGNPDGEETPVLVSIPNLKAGSTIPAYVQVPGADESKRDVPVLDNTLTEYAQYVLPADFASDNDEAAEKLAAEEAEAAEPLVNDDQAANEEVPAE